MRKPIYTVVTAVGVTYHIEAASDSEAMKRAASTAIGDHLAELMRQAVSNVVSIELYRGPIHLTRYPIFQDSVFKN